MACYKCGANIYLLDRPTLSISRVVQFCGFSVWGECHSDCQDRAAEGLQNCLGLVIILVGTPGQALPLCCVPWSSAMLNDLRVKLDRYEAKAAHCQRAAQEATDVPGRAFYQELADYYGGLARSFRQVIANREAEERDLV